MPLPAGAKLGPCEILAPVGAGGMDEMYKARHRALAEISGTDESFQGE
jgi:hypothetical protein